MSLLQTIKSDQIDARKSNAKAKANVLTLLISDSEMIGKNDGNREVRDDEVIAVVKKHIKGVQECLALPLEATITLAKKLELDLLNEYLPKQLSADQIKDVIKVLQIANPALKLPEAMAHFKQYYMGQYDGKLVSTTAKELLGG